VIATGFQRESLPQLAKRGQEITVETARPQKSPAPVPIFEPEPEPVFMEPAPLAAEPSEPPVPEVHEEQQPQLAMNDLDMPAYLRRDRRLYQ
jgi:hypothetical protein